VTVHLLYRRGPTVPAGARIPGVCQGGPRTRRGAGKRLVSRRTRATGHPKLVFPGAAHYAESEIGSTRRDGRWTRFEG